MKCAAEGGDTGEGEDGETEVAIDEAEAADAMARGSSAAARKREGTTFLPITAASIRAWSFVLPP